MSVIEVGIFGATDRPFAFFLQSLLLTMLCRRCRSCCWNWRSLVIIFVVAMFGGDGGSPCSFSMAFSSSPISSSQPSLATPSTGTATTSCAVVGCGVLGTSLCQQILADPDFASWKVFGVTKTNRRHESLLEQLATDEQEEQRFQVETIDSLAEGQQRFRNVVFCAPPSGFDDYPAAVEHAVKHIWAGPEEGGVFIFTSSGGIYGTGDGETVTETSPVSVDGNPRSARLIQAEKVCLAQGGACLRLAGLYLLARGAHSYWLSIPEGRVNGRDDGIVNLLHYDDAASACLAAIKAGPSIVS